MAELSEKLKEKAKIELNETDEIRDDCILQLQVFSFFPVLNSKSFNK